MDAFHERTDDYNQSREKNQVWRWNFCKFCCIVRLFAPVCGANTHKKETITVDDMKKEAEREARTMWQFIRTFLKWLVIAGVTGGIGGLLGIPAGFAAALGLVCVFCGAVNCPIASMVLSIELFGAGQLVYFALACGIAYMLSGYFGLYSSQKILYSKLRTEFINIHAK